jgi:ABC-2 type transport system permease protein
MFHRLWTLIRKELQSLLREPQTRAILILPVVIQVLLFPFAATLEVTNATIAVYNEDNGKHAVELTQRFARAKAFTHVLMLKSPQEIRPTIDEQKRCCWCVFRLTFPASSIPSPRRRYS